MTLFLLIVIGFLLVLLGGQTLILMTIVRRSEALIFKLEASEEQKAALQSDLDKKKRELWAAHTSLELVLKNESKQVQDMNTVLEMVLDGT